MKIGFIGLGVQGKPLALNLRRAGHDLMVYDARREHLAELAAAGASLAQSAEEVGGYADFVATCVLDDAQTEEVVLGENGVLQGASRGLCLIIHSTILPSTVSRISAAASRVGVDVVEAPVSGGARGASERNMSFMVGGSDTIVERCAPIFAASGDKITRTGPLGTAMQVKIAHQLIVSLNMLAAHAGIKLGLAAGVQPHTMMSAIRDGAAQSRIADSWFSLNLGDHAVDVFGKDLDLCSLMAEELGIEMPAVEFAKSLLSQFVPRNDLEVSHA